MTETQRFQNLTHHLRGPDFGLWAGSPKNKSPTTRCQQKNKMNMDEIKSTPAMVPSCPIPPTKPALPSTCETHDSVISNLASYWERRKANSRMLSTSPEAVPRSPGLKMERFRKPSIFNKQTLKTLKTNKQSQATTGSTASTASERTSKLQHGSFMLIQRLMFGVKPPHGIQ